MYVSLGYVTILISTGEDTAFSCLSTAFILCSRAEMLRIGIFTLELLTNYEEFVFGRVHLGQ